MKKHMQIKKDLMINGLSMTGGTGLKAMPFFHTPFARPGNPNKDGAAERANFRHSVMKEPGILTRVM